MFTSKQCLNKRYKLQEKLGRTASGRQTWLTTDLQSKEKVVVKLLAFSPEMHWDELKLFKREAQVLKSLTHPRIPQYRDYFTLDREMETQIPWFALVQDYIPGDSLQNRLDKDQHFSEEELRSIATQVLEILIYLHELSPPVLHRDIKPSNLILGEDKQVYLVDFGAVQAQAAVTGVTFTVVGTSGYAPLEQFWGRAVPASDLYALGATLIHLLTGTAPADLPHKEGQIQFRDRISLNSNFINWIEQMTEMGLDKRFSTAKQAIKALKYGQIQLSQFTSDTERRKLSKPSGSLIQIQADKDRLAITIPSPGLRKILEFNITEVGCFSVIMTFLICIWLFSLMSGELVTFVIVTLTLANLVYSMAREIFTKKHVEFDRIRGTLELSNKPIIVQSETTNSGKMKDKKCININEINDIHLIKQSLVYQVIITTNNDFCELSIGGALGEQESAWLLQEIVDWLGKYGENM
jgi:serine/threonine protein kinase